ncbi:aldehyde-activating protein [Pseudomonas silesiensis]|uniref:Aldehyde-activating protein n=1 Tax=Pseudomonas silesiensis TaxID=1853130 RepID=A0A191Z353_9PSED|nr:GFA family protein [Pseudomonas silesiensis]ANJ59463.1 aldehyde-activating protein [Pseudomonas silesiensis]
MLKAIGKTPIQPHHRASCHCGAVVLEIHLPAGLPQPHRCDCSFCKRKGAIVAAVPATDLKVIRGQAVLRKYQFGRQVAEHFFCGICGIYTHHRRSTNPNEFGFNIGCMEGVNPYDLGSVPVADGGKWEEPMGQSR